MLIDKVVFLAFLAGIEGLARFPGLWVWLSWREGKNETVYLTNL